MPSHAKPSSAPSKAISAATFAGGALLVLIGIVVTFQFVKPAPPDHVGIAAGASDGAYYRYAEAYGRILAREGIRLNIVETAGSVENLKLLGDGQPGVDLAIVQGGIPAADAEETANALGSLFFEPVWILQRHDGAPTRLNAMKGKRIGIGPEGSGTRFVATHMLRANGVDETNATLVSDDLERGADLLIDGGLDLLFVVASPDSPLLRRLISNGDIRIGDLERAPAYARIDTTLSALELPRGSLDLAADIPPQDIRLVGATASLVAHRDLHPALVDLLIMAAAEVHGQGDLFAEPGEFPSPEHTDLPLNADAERHYEYGPPFLQRFMPFWAATLVDRLKIMLLPLIGLMFPLFKAMPPFLRWRVRSRIYRWYSELRAIDLASRTVGNDEAHRRRLELEVERIEEELRQVEVPLSYADQLYNLRLHVQLIRDQLQAGG